MSDTVIRVENLAKRYRVGASEEGYKTLRESVVRAAARPFHRPPRSVHGGESKGETGRGPEIWALRGLNLEIRQGEVLGIIGRNGAGKSTLLKLLSQVTEPTEGRVKIKGRVAPLLEVGTGFHPELTGRENIFLNASILGMSRAEIRTKFDEIVAFAEVEKFVDTPVKRYSSGMYLRLAFAVAAHLEPEILLVDEVLAVGDAEFQRKCMGKMGDVARTGRTVLFVSHSMGAVNRLCRQGLWLDRGQLRIIGPVEAVVGAYMADNGSAGGERSWVETENAPGYDKLRLRRLRILDRSRQVTANVDIRHTFSVEIEYEVLRRLHGARVALRVLASDGTIVLTSADSSDTFWEGKPRETGVYASRCQIPGNLLNEGEYVLTVSADVPGVEVLLFEENALSFRVEQTGGVSGRYSERWPGVICPALPWRVERTSAETSGGPLSASTPRV